MISSLRSNLRRVGCWSTRMACRFRFRGMPPNCAPRGRLPLSCCLTTRIKPKLRELNINDDIWDGFVEKSEWDSLTEVPFL